MMYDSEHFFRFMSNKNTSLRKSIVFVYSRHLLNISSQYIILNYSRAVLNGHYLNHV